ncbi:hypothetical protein GQ600_12612 [Phytophthora cactorum]|nr:hypothetical protein GQ600_12612 [Phytophthora cactorum]
MPRHTAVSFVKNVRKQLTGGDVFRAIELEPTFHYVYAHAGVIKRMIGFAHPDCFVCSSTPKTHSLSIARSRSAPSHSRSLPYLWAMILL